MLRLALAAFLCLPPTAAGPSIPPVASAPVTPLLSARRIPGWIDANIAAQRLAGSLDPLTKGIDGCVEVGQAGMVAYDANGAQDLLPASNMKLVSATADLDILGPSYRFTTTVAAVARPHGGTLAGNLYLVGGGDPNLMTAGLADGYFGAKPVFTDVQQLVSEVKAAGITRIEGSVVGDASRYDSLTGVPSWLPVYRSEGDVGPLSALEVNRSIPMAASATTPAANTTTPPVGASPPLVGAETFTTLLQAAGVVVSGPATTGVTPAAAGSVASVQSPPLNEEVDQMLTVSDDLAAELFVKELGFKTSHQGTTAAGVAAVRQDMAADGLPVGQLVVIDGSGLDTGDRATCGLLLDTVERAGTTSDVANGYPVAGRTGTLAHRFIGTAAAGRIHAKTGTLDQVSALSGYVVPLPGAPTPGLAGPVYFSIIVNGMPSYLSYQLVDRIATAISVYPSALPVAGLGPKTR